MGMLNNFFNKAVKESMYPLGSKECGNFLKEVYKESIDDTIILTEDIYEKISKYDEINEKIKNLEFEKKSIEHFLQNEMKEYETAFCKERKMTWKSTEKTTIDTKSLKKDNPELASRYLRTSKSRIFKIY